MSGGFVLGFSFFMIGCSGGSPSPTLVSAGTVTEITRTDGQSHALPPEPPQDELLVTFKPGTSVARREAIHQSVGCRVLNQMLSGRIAHVKLPRGKTLEEVQSAYAKFPEVEAAEPNAPVEAQGHDTPTR